MRNTVPTVATLLSMMTLGWENESSHARRPRKQPDAPELPLDQNHPLIHNALVTTKYRVNNKIKKFLKFHKRHPTQDEFVNIIHRCISEIGNSLPSKEMCEAYYTIMKKSMEIEDETEEEKNAGQAPGNS